MAKSDVKKLIINLDAEMREAAEKLDFEKAIQIRDQIQEIQNLAHILIEVVEKVFRYKS